MLVRHDDHVTSYPGTSPLVPVVQCCSVQRTSLLGLLSLIGLTTLLLWYSPQIEGIQDIQIYRRIGNDAHLLGQPDHQKLESEYPPLASTLFSILTLPALHLPFATAWAGFLLLAIFAGYIALWRISGQRDASLFVLAVLCTALLAGPELFFARFDILVLLFLVLSWKSWDTKHFFWSGLTLTVAFGLKLVPLLLLPALVLLTPNGKRRNVGLGVLAGACIGIGLPLLILGPQGFASNIHHFLSYHNQRSIQIESTWSGFHLLLSILRQQKDPIGFVALSAQNMALGKGLALVASCLVLLGTAAITLWSWQRRRKHRDEWGIVLILILLWILMASPIFSPQYLVWVLPLVALWTLSSLTVKKQVSKMQLALIILFAAVCGGTRWVFPLHYVDLLNGQNLPIVILNLRKLALVLLTLSFGKGWWGSAPHRPVMPLSSKAWRRLVVLSTAAFLVGFGIFSTLKNAVTPVLGQAEYHFDDGKEEWGDMSLFVPSHDNQTMDVWVNVTLPAIYPTVLRIKPDDCITAFEINGKAVDDSFHFCDFGSGRPLDLSAYLHPGVNNFHLRISDQGGLVGMSIIPEWTASAFLWLHFFLLLLLVAYGSTLIWGLRRRGVSPTLTGVLLLGTILRIIYFIITPYAVRGHDTDAHINYIKYIAEHFTVPPASGGWEFHQAPLYYLLAGAWLRMGQTFHRSLEFLLLDIQRTSLLLSIATLAICFWIAKMLFPRRKQAGRAALFLLLPATLPSFLFLAARITNDALYQPLSFLTFAFLLSWWQTRKMRTWYALCVSIALSFLTKVSAILFLPAAFLPFLLQKKMTLRRKGLHLVLSTLLIVLLAGWLPVVRLFIEKDVSKTLSLGNLGMHSGLLLPSRPGNLLTFNPVKILTTPYNNPWDDAYRRQYYPEYFFRSAFTGEFSFASPLRPLNILALACGLLALPLLLLGCIVEGTLHLRERLPIFLIFSLLLAASIGFRLAFPYGSNQDFRFVMLLVIPFSFFAVQGTYAIHGLWRRGAHAILIALAASCTLFIFALSIV